MKRTRGETAVNLAHAPGERWRLTWSQRRLSRSLVKAYLRDLGAGDELAALAEQAARDVVPARFVEEMEGIAGQRGMPFRSIAVANLYYDALKFAWGCTAMAFDTKDGPVHARNLNWWTENRLLNHGTMVSRFEGCGAGSFITVGWPGFIGALSGVAPGRFAITLNAVLSEAPPTVALPVVFLIRDVFETCSTFDEAVRRLAETPVASDSLLLVTGASRGEMVVIEPTPTSNALRHPEHGAVWVANDYKLIDAGTGAPGSDLQATSCGRYDRVGRLLEERFPQSLHESLAYLSDPEIKMAITVQQMAFAAHSGEYAIRIP